MCKLSFWISIGVVLTFAVYIAAQSSDVSRCFQFTWLGPRYNNNSVFLNATCQDATRLASGVPCQEPLVASYSSAGPIVVWFRTDGGYVGRGFKLNYQQNACQT